jgi:hypothetical protein
MKGPEEEQRYSCTLQPWHEMWVGGQRHASTALLPGKKPGTCCTGGLVGPQDRSGRVRKISPPAEFDPRTVQAVASRYNDYAIPAHKQDCNI